VSVPAGGLQPSGHFTDQLKFPEPIFFKVNNPKAASPEAIDPKFISRGDMDNTGGKLSSALLAFTQNKKALSATKTKIIFFSARNIITPTKRPFKFLTQRRVLRNPF